MKLRTNGGLFVALLVTIAVFGTSVASANNMALGKPATASGIWSTDIPANAFDGDSSTNWNAGGYPTQWIEVDLGAEYPVLGLRLQIAQFPNGGSTHLVTGRSNDGTTVELATFSGYTVSSQWLENLTIPFTQAVRYVRVTTTASPSWVSWLEIEVLSDSTVPQAETSWSKVKALFR